MRQQLKKLYNNLGYINDPGFLETSAFQNAFGSIHSLSSAASHANVVASFGVWEHGFNDQSSARFVPLVYVAHANSKTEARQVHRWVWSQGISPWLLIEVSGNLLICPGFDFPDEASWESKIKVVEINSLSEGVPSLSLDDFSAVKLRSSLQWRDFRLTETGSVDKKLLRALNDLYTRLSSSEANTTSNYTNRLVGRLFYTFLLLDRKLIPDTWSPAIQNANKQSDGRGPLIIPLKEFWSLQDRIDDIFNGSVFPIKPDERRTTTQEQLNLAISFIRSGTTLNGGGEQTSLFDIDLTALQVETLSAVYEAFLRNESPEQMRNDGVVYTPSFLVDFVINRLDDEMALDENSKILDPTAGSGVFLVAAFRRIIERTLSKRRLSNLPMLELQNILTNCIFGIEKSVSAAAVTTFSLYLNLLEYCDPNELLQTVNEKRRPRVFPKLIDKNILVRDFFRPPKHFSNLKFTSVVGNPPWKPISDVSEHSEEIEIFPVDGDEAAEQIVWDTLTNYLQPNGMLAMVMPSKSFASPSAKTFATSLGRKFHIKAIVNLSHWRRHLFANAGQPAALLFVSNSSLSNSSRTLFYAPLLWTQPFTPRAMWTLTVDRSDVSSLPSLYVFQSAENTFDAYSLKPIDRAVKTRLNHGVATKNASTLGDTLQELGLRITGGSTPRRTNLQASEICTSEDFSLARDPNRSRFLHLRNHPKELSQERLSVCHEVHTKKFSDIRLIVPRTLQYVRLLDFPLAVNSSLNIIFWQNKEDQNFSPELRLRILARLGQFLTSNLARYQFALFGQLWQIDKTRIEINDILKISAPRSDFFLQEGELALTSENLLLDMHAEDVIEPMQDYLKNRTQFENGKSPETVTLVEANVSSNYLAVLESTLKASLGPLLLTSCVKKSDATSILFNINVKEPLPIPPSRSFSNSIFQFHESTQVSWEHRKKQISIKKPNESLYLTLDRAYADALMICNLLLKAKA
jgi:type I restriction-modification system DNA methylase subunit